MGFDKIYFVKELYSGPIVERHQGLGTNVAQIKDPAIVY